MNSKPDETLSKSKAAGSARAPTVLRLLPGGKRQGTQVGSAEAARRTQNPRPHRDGNDDDPGPTAA